MFFPLVHHFPLGCKLFRAEDVCPLPEKLSSFLILLSDYKVYVYPNISPNK